jgi:hypothetical protein
MLHSADIDTDDQVLLKTISGILWPDCNANAEWSPETLTEIANSLLGTGYHVLDRSEPGDMAAKFRHVLEMFEAKAPHGEIEDFIVNHCGEDELPELWEDRRQERFERTYGEQLDAMAPPPERVTPLESAFRVVLDLAGQNVIDSREREMADQREEQENALTLVTEHAEEFLGVSL